MREKNHPNCVRLYQQPNCTHQHTQCQISTPANRQLCLHFPFREYNLKDIEDKEEE